MALHQILNERINKDKRIEQDQIKLKLKTIPNKHEYMNGGYH